MSDRFLAIGTGGDVVTGAFERPRQETAEGIVVFGKEDARHGLHQMGWNGSRSVKAFHGGRVPASRASL
jgi:hypothetical protein